jgi:hypothetical protein
MSNPNWRGPKIDPPADGSSAAKGAEAAVIGYLTSRHIRPALICLEKQAKARAFAFVSAPAETGRTSSSSPGHGPRGAAPLWSGLPLVGEAPAKNIAAPSRTQAGRPW